MEPNNPPGFVCVLPKRLPVLLFDPKADVPNAPPLVVPKPAFCPNVEVVPKPVLPPNGVPKDLLNIFGMYQLPPFNLRQYKLSPAQPWGVELDDLRSLPNTNHSVSLSTPARAPKGHLAADTQDSHCSSCSTLRVFPDFSIKPHLPTPSNKTSGTAQPRNCRNTPSICFLLTLTGLHQDFLHFLKLTASKYSLRGVSPQFTTHWCISRHVSLCCLAPSSSPSTNTM